MKNTPLGEPSESPRRAAGGNTRKRKLRLRARSADGGLRGQSHRQKQSNQNHGNTFPWELI